MLLAFPTCQPPAEALLEHLPRLAPRPYSAASIQRDGRLLDFVFNVAEIPSGPARAFSRRGVCTGWFEDMAKSGNLQKVSTRRSVNQIPCNEMQLVWVSDSGLCSDQHKVPTPYGPGHQRDHGWTRYWSGAIPRILATEGEADERGSTGCEQDRLFHLIFRLPARGQGFLIQVN